MFEEPRKWNLESAIVTWRGEMRGAGIQAPELLEELECHLREELDSQTGEGASEREAFTEAVRMIGAPADIHAEFDKSLAEQEEQLWRQGQIGLLVMALVLQLGVAGLILGSSDMVADEKLSALSALGISSCLAAGLKRGHRFVPALTFRRKRLLVEAALGVLACGAAYIVARTCSLDQEASFGRFIVKLLWISGPPLAVYFGIIGCFETAARRALPAKKTVAKAALLLVACLLCPSLTMPRANAAERTSEAVALDAALSKQLPADGVGSAVLVAKGGEILFSHGYGLADREQRTPVTDQTRFRIGSMTKQFTAAAILRLASDGRLSVEDPLTKYFPGYPGGDKITLRHLLNHTSGLHNYTDRPDFPGRVAAFIAADELVAWFRNDPPDFPPGEQFRYSNTGYFLLGGIVAKVTGGSLGNYLQQQFFTPLGMRDTGTWTNAGPPERAAKGYSFDGKGLQPAVEWDMSWAGGAGELYSTTGDIWRWTEALQGGRVLSAESLKTALEEFKVMKPETLSLRYGMGLYHTDVEWLPAIGHTGGLPGYLSEVMWLPEQHATVIVLSNAMPPKPGTSPAELLPVMVRAFFGAEIAAHAPKEESVPDTKAYAALTGRYQYPTGVQTVTTEEGRLYAQLDGQPRYEIFSSAPGEFFYKVVAARIVFHRDENSGSVISLSHSQNGMTFTAPKLSTAPLEVPLADEILDACTGRYQYSVGAIMTISRSDHQLYAQLSGQPKFPIFPKSAHEFFWKAVDASVEFIAGPDGKIVKVIHHQSGATLDAPKVE